MRITLRHDAPPLPRGLVVRILDHLYVVVLPLMISRLAAPAASRAGRFRILLVDDPPLPGPPVGVGRRASGLWCRGHGSRLSHTRAIGPSRLAPRRRPLARAGAGAAGAVSLYLDARPAGQRIRGRGLPITRLTSAVPSVVMAVVVASISTGPPPHFPRGKLQAPTPFPPGQPARAHAGVGPRCGGAPFHWVSGIALFSRPVGDLRRKQKRLLCRAPAPGISGFATPARASQQRPRRSLSAGADWRLVCIAASECRRLGYKAGAGKHLCDAKKKRGRKDRGV